MKTTMKIAIIALMGMSLGINAQQKEYPITQPTVKINNSPWYGLGRSNLTMPNSNYESVQLAGYYGLLFKTAGGEFSLHQNGNLGIGTTNPNATLQIGDSDHTGTPAQEVEKKRLSIAPVTHSGSDWFFTSRDNAPYANLDIGYSSRKSLTLRHDGNVGIGTTNPTDKLTVSGNVNVGANGNASIKVRHINGKRGDSSDFDNLYLNYSTGKDVWIGSPGKKSALYIQGNFRGYGSIIGEQITSNGNILGRDIVSGGSNAWKIHTPDENGRTTMYLGPIIDGAFRWEKGVYFHNSGKVSFNNNISVKGKIESTEIKVTTSPTADFVFEEDYNLPTLKSIEKHIKEKKHLPEIASAKEMEKNGVNVGNFQIQLLQKIEELTLYTIDQQKEINLQKKEIQELKKQNSEIKEQQKKIEKLESLVQKLLKDKN